MGLEDERDALPGVELSYREERAADLTRVVRILVDHHGTIGPYAGPLKAPVDPAVVGKGGADLLLRQPHAERHGDGSGSVEDIDSYRCAQLEMAENSVRCVEVKKEVLPLVAHSVVVVVALLRGAIAIESGPLGKRLRVDLCLLLSDHEATGA